MQRFSVKKETKRDAILKGGPHDTNFFALFEIYLEEAISEVISSQNWTHNRQTHDTEPEQRDRLPAEWAESPIKICSVSSIHSILFTC